MANSEVLPAAAGEALRRGLVVPAMPLALDSQRRFDDRRQGALCRYYLAAGAGGLAVGVHTTQFAIRDPKHGLLRPVLALAANELARKPAAVRIAGVCGVTAQAVAEASLRMGGTSILMGYSGGPPSDCSSDFEAAGVPLN